jgi:hypothetical protein
MWNMEIIRKTWKRLLLALVLAVGIVVVLILGSAVRNYRLMPESYAAWTTGNLMVEYLETHTNQWPRNWEDLRSAKESYKGGGLYTEFEKLPTFVKIDWNVDVAILTRAAIDNSNSVVRVITRPDGSNLRAIWGPDTEPNTKVMKYLKEQSHNTSRGPIAPSVPALDAQTSRS